MVLPEIPAVILWVDEPAEFFFTKSGIAICRIKSGGQTIEYRGHRNVMLECGGNLSRAYVDHLAVGDAEIIPFPSPKT